MKLKKVIVPSLLCLLALVSCNSGPGDTIASAYKNTNNTFTGFTSNYTIVGEADTIVYEEENTFQIQRGDTTNTRFTSHVRRLNQNISVAYPYIYFEENSSYVTIDTMIYSTATTGVTSETVYEIPSKFLSFTIEKKFLSDVKSTKEEGATVIEGKVKDDSISSFFNGNAITSVSDFNFNATIEDKHLVTLNFTYVDSGDNISLNVNGSYSFTYGEVTVSR